MSRDHRDIPRAPRTPRQSRAADANRYLIEKSIPRGLQDQAAEAVRQFNSATP